MFLSKDPYWAPKVERCVAERSFRADETGKMIKPDNYAKPREQMLEQLKQRQPTLFKAKHGEAAHRV